MFVRIEKATREQADIVGQVHSETWRQAYQGVFTDSFLRDDTAEKRKQEFLESFGKAGVFYYVVYETAAPLCAVRA